MMIANTPTFKSFIRGNKNGCFSLDMTVSAMRASKSPSSAMLPALTGQSVSVLKDIVEDHDATLTGVFARLHLARPWANCASAVGGAKDLHKIIAKEAIALVSVGATDSEATRAIIQQLAVPEKALDDGKDETTPDALFLHMADVQTAGHVHGFGPHVEEYLHAIENADKRVSAVLEALRKRQETIKNEDWLVMVNYAAIWRHVSKRYASIDAGYARCERLESRWRETVTCEWRFRNARSLSTRQWMGFDRIWHRVQVDWGDLTASARYGYFTNYS